MTNENLRQQAKQLAAQLNDAGITAAVDGDQLIIDIESDGGNPTLAAQRIREFSRRGVMLDGEDSVVKALRNHHQTIELHDETMILVGSPMAGRRMQLSSPTMRLLGLDAVNPFQHRNRSLEKRKLAMDQLAGIIRDIDKKVREFKGPRPNRWLVFWVRMAQGDALDPEVATRLDEFIKGPLPLGSWNKARQLLEIYDRELGEE